MKSQKKFSMRSLLGLDWLNFFLADVQTGIGPFLAIYLAGYKWDQQQTVALTAFTILYFFMPETRGKLFK